VKSFRCCGITVKIDGSGDKEIYCIKDGGIAADCSLTFHRVQLHCYHLMQMEVMTLLLMLLSQIMMNLSKIK